MYVLINLDDMVFLHKHPKLDVICDLAHIEARHVSVLICDHSESSFLKGSTLLELQTLYKNSTGQPLPASYLLHQIRAVIADIADRLPVTDACPFEVSRQADKVDEDDERLFRYVRKAFSPAFRSGGLFPLQGAVSPMEAQIAQSATLVKKVVNNHRTPLAQAAEPVTLNSPLKKERNPNGITHEDDTMSKKELTPEEVAEKEAQAAAKAAEKAAQKEAEKAERAAQREAKKAEKQAEREAEKERKRLEREAARGPEQNGMRYPTEGSMTRSVWDNADQLSRELGRPCAIAELMERCNPNDPDGPSENTVRTQYAGWRKYHGISGRVVAPVTEQTEEAPQA